jgi:tetratricopeptide (TPR) repeat protein
MVDKASTQGGDGGGGGGGGEKGGVLARLGAELKALVKVTTILLVAALGAVMWSATQSRSIVIDFVVPPSLLSDKMSEETLARMVAGRIKYLRASTGTERSRTGSGRTRAVLPDTDWVDDLRIEIPQTGIAIGDAHKALRRLIGKDRYVKAVIRESNGKPTALDLLVDGKASTHPLTDKARMADEAAEAIYSQIDPLSHVFDVLKDSKLRQEGLAALHTLAFESPERAERALAQNALAVELLQGDGRCAEAMPFLRRAHVLDPELSAPFYNLSNAYYCLGHDQDSADATTQEQQVLRSFGARSERDGRRLLLVATDTLAGQAGDYAGRLRLYDEMETEGFGEKSLDRALALAENHDVRGSVSVPLPESATPTRREWLRFKQLWALRDWPRAAMAMRDLNARYRSWKSPYVTAQVATQNQPLEAMATAWSGRADLAGPMVSAMPNDCYLCVRAKAAVAAAAGRHDEADRWFGLATRLGPRLPFAYSEWAQEKLASGRIGEARELFAKAHRFGPNWADPLKGWGDTFMAQGQAEAAIAKYSAAAGHAPGWGALQVEWGKALWYAGRRQEALGKFRDAARIGLSAPDLRRALRLRCMAERALKIGGAGVPPCG